MSFNKKIAILSLMIVVFSFLFMPSFPAKGESNWQNLPTSPFGALLFGVQTLTGGGGPIASGIGNTVLSAIEWIPMKIGSMLTALSAWFADWIIHDPILDKAGISSYTNPAGNIIVKTGWTLLRDLTNIMFILGIAYIGLSTALDWANFQTKKTLGRIVLVALFINFSPIICGIFVDLADLIKNFFLPRTQLSQFALKLNEASDKLPFFKGEFELAEHLKYLIYIFYAFAVTTVMFLIGMYFLIRSFMIMLLVIFSPLVFFFWIFDKTKALFNQWQKQFITWVFTLVPLSFILYLVSFMMAKLDLFTDYSGDPSEGMIAELFGPIAVLTFLIIGFIFSFQIVSVLLSPIASGAKTAWRKTKKAGIRAYGGAKMAAKAGGGAAAIAAGGIHGATQGFKEGRKNKRGIAGAIRGGAKGVFTRRGREKGKEAGARTLERMHVLRPGSAEEIRKRHLGDVKEEQKKLKGLNISGAREDAIMRELNKSKVMTKKKATRMAALLQNRADEKRLKDEDRARVERFKEYLNAEIILKNKPSWIVDFPEELDKLNLDIIKNMKPADIQQISREGSKEIQDAVKDTFIKNNSKLNDHIINLAKQGKNNEADSIIKTLNEVVKTWP